MADWKAIVREIEDLKEQKKEAVANFNEQIEERQNILIALANKDDENQVKLELA